MPARAGAHQRPDFLGIGAPKAGTTWLYKQLSKHQQVWLPPEKELRYFNKRFPSPGAERPPNQRKGLFGLFPHYPRPVIWRTLKHSLKPRYGMDLRWAVRYLNGPGDFEWYSSLFSPAGERISGDITPFYCALDACAVRTIADHFPHLKVIYLMRDPVARAWSHARMMAPLMSGRPLAELDEDDFLAYLARESPHATADYVRTLAAWEASFPSEQLLILFYDELAAAPQSLLDRVVEHLGLASMQLDEDGLRERVNSGGESRYGNIPPRVRKALAERFLPQLDALAQRFPEPAERWRLDAQAAASAASQDTRA